MSAVGFTGSWLDRADAVRGDAAALADLRARGDARMLAMTAGEPAVAADGRLAWERLRDGPAVFLGLDAGGVPHFAALHPDAGVGAARSRALFGILDTLPPGDAAVFGLARALTDWHARHGWCPRCGGTTHAARGGWNRVCDACGTEHFPRVDPVVIMLAEHDGRVLVGRAAAWPAGRYSALAGFVEPGEGVEEAVARELFEEAGVRATAVRHVASQPWPFPAQLMIGCHAQVVDDTLVLDAAELADAIWVTAAEVGAALSGAADARFVPPPPYAIAHTLLARWAGGQ